MLTKAAYVVWVSSALKLRRGKKKFLSPYLPAFFLYPPYSPHLSFLNQLHSISLSAHPLLQTPCFNLPPLSVFIAVRQLYLPSNGTTWFIGWGWFKDPLLLLWGQRRVQWDDFDVTDIRPQVVDLPLDSLAGFVNFLKDGGTTINLGVTCVCKQQNQTGSEQHLDKQWRCIWVIGKARGGGQGNLGSLLQYICSNYRSIWRRKLNLDCSLLCWAPCGSVVKCSNHGKHGRALWRRTHTHTHSQPDRLKQGSLFHSAAL